MSDLGPGAINTDRFGINPNQQWDTPFGIYGYPLNNTYYKKLITGDLPFREDAPWVHVFTVDLQKCLSASRYTSRDLHRDLELLRQFGVEVSLAAKETARVQTPAGIIWNVTRVAAKGSTTKWSRLFRRLGYHSFWDSKCQGIIHPNEKCQIVAFSTGAAKRLNVVPNPSILDKYTSMGFKPSPSRLQKALKGWKKDRDDLFYRTVFLRDIGLTQYEVNLEKHHFTLYMRIPFLEFEDWINSKGEWGKKEFMPLSLLRVVNSIAKKATPSYTPKAWEFKPLRTIPIHELAAALEGVASYGYNLKYGDEGFVITHSVQGNIILDVEIREKGATPMSKEEAERRKNTLINLSRKYPSNIDPKRLEVVPLNPNEILSISMASNITGSYILIETTLGFIVATGYPSPKVVNSQGKLELISFKALKVEEIKLFPTRDQALRKMKEIHEKEMKALEERYS